MSVVLSQDNKLTIVIVDSEEGVLASEIFKNYMKFDSPDA